MGVEIERKFLLASDGWRSGADGGVRMVQGYFERTPNGPTVRVRIAGLRAFLTVKGAAKNFSRSEFEYDIPVADAEAMLREFCADRLVEKIRYHVSFSGAVWEVDEYFGGNEGLFTAELELESEDAALVFPPWLGREVTGDRRYTNGSLSINPYRNWADSVK